MISLGEWKFDEDTGELSKSDEKVRLPEQQLKAFNLLVTAGHNALVPRDTFIATLWPDGRVVEYDQSLNTCIRKLRKALLDNADNPTFIETIPGKGYRLLVPPVDVHAKDIPFVKSPSEKTVFSNEKKTYLGKLIGITETKTRLGWGLATIVMALTITIILAFHWYGKNHDRHQIQRLIVLPFKSNKQIDNTLTFSGNAIREALLSKLAKIPAQELIVISGESVFSWNNNEDLHLSSDLILSGMTQEDPLNIQLFYRINNKEGQLLWSDSYNWLKGGGLNQQSTIVQGIVDGLLTQLSISITTDNKPAPQPTLIPSELVSNTFNEAIFLAGQNQPESAIKAIKMLNALVAQSPNHGAAMVWLATLHQQQGSSNIQLRPEAFSAALKWVASGLRLIPDSAELYRVLAYIQFYGQWNVNDAFESIEKAVSLAPNNAQIRSLRAAILMVNEDIEGALSQARLAQNLDPLAMLINADYCWYLNFARQFQNAINECSNTLNLQPDDVWTRLGLIEAQRQTNDWQGALDSLNLILNSSPGSSQINSPQPKADFKKSYMTWIQQLEKGHLKGQIDPFMIAAFYAQIEEQNKSIQWLMTAKKEKSGFFIFVNMDPRFDSVKDLEAFKTLSFKQE